LKWFPRSHVIISGTHASKWIYPPEKLLICHKYITIFVVKFVDFNIIYTDKIKAICNGLYFVWQNYVKINKINKKL